jgi:translation initiation factor eIF-2B subunit delta
MLSRKFRKEVEIIHNDTQSGAAKIAEDCLNTLKQECLRIGQLLERPILKTAIQMLLDTHPMATIENALLPIYVRMNQILNTERLQKGNPRAIIEMIFNTHREKMRIGEKNTIRSLFTILKKEKSILTLSYSSTVIKALLQLSREGYRDKELFILESRPLKEGERTAQTLAMSGFKTHIGIDFAVTEFANKANLAVLGADMVHQNGQILNKMGSATVAELFSTRSKKVIVAASLSKICIRGIIDPDHSWHPIISHRNPKEITTVTNPNLIVWNKYFEIIQPKFISTLIMDRHLFQTPIEAQIEEFLRNDKTLSAQINALREAWYDVDYAVV